MWQMTDFAGSRHPNALFDKEPGLCTVVCCWCVGLEVSTCSRFPRQLAAAAAVSLLRSLCIFYIIIHLQSQQGVEHTGDDGVPGGSTPQWCNG